MLDDIIKKKKAELRALPKGSLIRKNGCYYHKHNGVEKGITKDPELVAALARSRYLQKEILLLEKNLELAKGYDASYRALVPSELIESLPPSYHHLPAHYFMGTEGHDSASANPYKREHLKYLSNGGILMRSKSEVMIANELEACSISYQYEPRILLDGKVLYPDFLFQHPWDKRTVIWEHLGLMDLRDYEKNNQDKLTLYYKNGFYPFYNLICSFEEDIKDRQQIRQILRLLHLA